jgi:hypothetical protein
LRGVNTLQEFFKGYSVALIHGEHEKRQHHYLPRDLAQYMSRLIDKGITLKTQFIGVTGGTQQYECYGALVEINF